MAGGKQVELDLGTEGNSIQYETKRRQFARLSWPLISVNIDRTVFWWREGAKRFGLMGL